MSGSISADSPELTKEEFSARVYEGYEKIRDATYPPHSVGFSFSDQEAAYAQYCAAPSPEKRQQVLEATILDTLTDTSSGSFDYE